VPVRSPAERPVRSAAKAFDTRSAEPCDPTGDFLSRERPCSTISVGLVAGQRYQRPARPQQRFCWLPPVAPTEDLSPEQLGGVPAAWRRSASLSHRRVEPTLVPGPRPPVITCSRTDSPTAVISNGVSSLGQRSREVFEVFLSSMWLAVFKMMHRSGGRQGYGQLLTAFAGLTDRERSPQNFSSALWAPLTLRLSPGAASFQHQPTREETT